MNKNELTEKLRQQNGLSRPEAQKAVQVVFDSITAALASGGRVEIRGVCSLQCKDYKPYKGRNPKTGKVVKVKAKRLPFFKAGTELRQRADY